MGKYEKVLGQAFSVCAGFNMNFPAVDDMVFGLEKNLTLHHNTVTSGTDELKLPKLLAQFLYRSNNILKPLCDEVLYKVYSLGSVPRSRIDHVLKFSSIVAFCCAPVNDLCHFIVDQMKDVRTTDKDGPYLILSSLWDYLYICHVDPNIMLESCIDAATRANDPSIKHSKKERKKFEACWKNQKKYEKRLSTLLTSGLFSFNGNKEEVPPINEKCEWVSNVNDGSSELNPLIGCAMSNLMRNFCGQLSKLEYHGGVQPMTKSQFQSLGISNSV